MTELERDFNQLRCLYLGGDENAAYEGVHLALNSSVPMPSWLKPFLQIMMYHDEQRKRGSGKLSFHDAQRFLNWQRMIHMHVFMYLSDGCSLDIAFDLTAQWVAEELKSGKRIPGTRNRKAAGETGEYGEKDFKEIVKKAYYHSEKNQLYDFLP